MKRPIMILLVSSAFSLFAAEKVIDVSDPNNILIVTDDKGVQNAGTLHAAINNYPQLKAQLLAETGKKLESEDEIAAVKRMSAIAGIEKLAGEKIDIPKTLTDKHNARIAKFGKAKEDAINAAIKKASEPLPKIDSKSSSLEIAAFQKQLSDEQSLAQRAKAKQDDLIAAGIPISDATRKAVEAAQPKPSPAPAPVATPTPDGL